MDLTKALAIQGWMEPDELDWLAKMASVSQTVIEVGSWKGRSARAIVDNLPPGGRLYVVDNWCDASERQDLRNQELIDRGPEGIEADWRANLADAIDDGRVHLHRGNSPDMAAVVAVAMGAANRMLIERFPSNPLSGEPEREVHTFLNGDADVVFIDADHAAEGCLADIRAYEDLVRPGGIIAGHDYTTANHPGVKRAVDWHFESRVRQGPGSIWYVRK